MKEKVSLISGGGSGIGAAIARKLASEGAMVAVMGRRSGPLEAVAEECGGLAIVGDATSGADCDRAVRLTVERFGRLDGLVANAGASGGAPALDTDDNAWADALTGNLTTAFALARASLPVLIESRGAIVVMSSLAGLFALDGHLGYTTAKHALIGFARSLARDYGPRGVRVNTICPGPVRTEMLGGLIETIAAKSGTSVENAYAEAAADLPLRRMAEPEEIAAICAFLLSDEASIITGAVIPADGGASIVDPGSLALSRLATG
jgi:NAD(P)-dependent dehydrogenase (short-subunit alcohol dehydrogenase family)